HFTRIRAPRRRERRDSRREKERRIDFFLSHFSSSAAVSALSASRRSYSVLRINGGAARLERQTRNIVFQMLRLPSAARATATGFPFVSVAHLERHKRSAPAHVFTSSGRSTL